MVTIWELDFYSRPILDENKKKIWEVLVCESPLDSRTNPDSLFRYAKYCPSTQVNSVWLKTALEEAINEAGVTPVKFRFFRRQMNNMIVKACAGNQDSISGEGNMIDRFLVAVHSLHRFRRL